MAEQVVFKRELLTGGSTGVSGAVDGISATNRGDSNALQVGDICNVYSAGNSYNYVYSSGTADVEASPYLIKPDVGAESGKAWILQNPILGLDTTTTIDDTDWVEIVTDVAGTPTSKKIARDDFLGEIYGLYQPIFVSENGSVTPNPSYDTLSYVKKGDDVTVRGTIIFSAVSSNTGELTFTLPFTAMSGTEYQTTCYVRTELLAVAATNFLSMRSSTTTAIMYEQGYTTTDKSAVSEKIGVGTALTLEFSYQAS